MNRFNPYIIIALAVFSSLSSLAWTDEPRAIPVDLNAAAKRPGPQALAAPRDGSRGTCTGTSSVLLYPRDGTYTLVNFLGDGPTGATPACAPYQNNDDDSATVPLPFLFDFYGDLRSDCFVNNNGNLTFGEYFSSFLPVGFPDASIPPMVAPFWGDVDTGTCDDFFGGPIIIGNVYMKFLDSNGDAARDTLVVTWENVGYYSQHDDLRNTFQVAISDGTNPTMGLDNNVCFSYSNMCWTTGDASDGIGGFGGYPATVGANRGNGINFFQVGLFDHPGADHDGPAGATDGVDYLDNLNFCFSTSTTNSNIPPIPTDFPNNNEITLDASLNQAMDLTVRFLSPESNQTTSVALTDSNGAIGRGLLVTNTPGNVAALRFQWTPVCGDVGDYVIQMTASDSFAPPGVTPSTLTVHVICPCTQPPNVTTQPLSHTVCEGSPVTLIIAATGQPPLQFQWRKDGVGISGQTGTTLSLPSATVDNFGNYDVEVRNACGSVISDAATVIVWPHSTGDINGSGTIDGMDVAAFMTAMLSSPNGPPALDFCGADMNGDGRLTVADVPLFIARLLGL